MTAGLEVVAVRYGTVDSRKSEMFHRFATYGEPDGPQSIDFFFYVLSRGSEVVLVDTGFDPSAAPPRGRRCLISPREALARLGVDPAAVGHVIVTHFHWDHVGNLALFPNARLSVPVRELEFWSDPIARNEQFWSHVEPRTIAELQDAHRDGRAVTTGAEETIVPGVRVLTVGGHSPGQQIIVVDTARGPVVLASDAAHLYEEMELARPFGVLVDLREMCEAYGLLARMGAEDGATIVPGHDPEVANRFPSLDGDGAGIGFRIA